jgi:hypothetical protein
MFGVKKGKNVPSWYCDEDIGVCGVDSVWGKVSGVVEVFW